jgi:ATP adenylyltransferase/5',5'''-P-1,P-4-tetraphosphate phosphorylase II
MSENSINNIKSASPPAGDLGGLVKKLLQEQLAEWDLAGGNYAALKSVQSKDFDFGTFTIRVQFNPARIVSSSAKVDAKTIQERKCFLCPANLPPVQRGVPFGKDYQILVNPFPIFPEHLTIPSIHHEDQLIFDRFEDMLDLAESLDEFVIFYNGPKCGASAPDHVHFQAGNKGFLPLENDVKSVPKKMIAESDETTVYSLENYLRNIIVIESANKQAVVETFKNLYSQLEIKEGEREPMLNVVAWFANGSYICCVFPRSVHRPKCFFAEGDKNILLSPASVDIGGVFITPQEKDFAKITAQDIEDILKEVC